MKSKRTKYLAFGCTFAFILVLFFGWVAILDHGPGTTIARADQNTAASSGKLSRTAEAGLTAQVPVTLPAAYGAHSNVLIELPVVAYVPSLVPAVAQVRLLLPDRSEAIQVGQFGIFPNESFQAGGHNSPHRFKFMIPTNALHQRNETVRGIVEVSLVDSKTKQPATSGRMTVGDVKASNSQ